MRNRALIIDLKVTLKANYFNKTNDAYFPYGIQKARLQPDPIYRKMT